MSSEYETLEKIGHGSFGVIRKVRRKTDGFIMCRKEISYLRMSQKEREQLHAEFHILSHLRHANIVAYYHREHLKASQDLHLYMEYCGNGDLGRVIKELQDKDQHAKESFVWSIFSQLVLALYRCHYGVDPPDVGSNVLDVAHGSTGAAAAAPRTPAGAMTILHRDLKPENVFLGEDNSVKLGDFGLSKMIKSQEFASTYVGTPFYMSPEICAAEKYTLKSDIWSLGCIIYELCARQPPFNATTHYQLVQRIKGGKVAPLPDLYSPKLSQVIRDCLRVNPDERPDTVQLMNVPIVRLARREKEVADLERALRAREERLRHKEQELGERVVAALDKERAKIRDDVDHSLRLEWEVKARLEIDRLVNAELESLQGRFEDEVRARVEGELARRAAEEEAISAAGAGLNHDYARANASGGNEHAPPSMTTTTTTTTTTTDMGGECAMTSPDSSREIRKAVTRTPFTRAQTMFAGNHESSSNNGGSHHYMGTPMDIEMASPSPMAAIASLSLSPRRNGTSRPPTAKPGNIFAAAEAAAAAAAAAAQGEGGDRRWDVHRETTNMVDDSDDEEICPSPTRHIKSSKNPFKNRPVVLLASQQQQQQQARPSCRAATSRLRCQVKTTASQPDLGTIPRSPSRSPTKIPIASSGDVPSTGTGSGSSSSSSSSNSSNTTTMTTATTNCSSSAASSSREDGGLSRTRSVKRDVSGGGGGGGSHGMTAVGAADSLGKVAAKNNFRGRTLVELQQARAGGRTGTGTAAVMAVKIGGGAGAAAKENMSPPKRGPGSTVTFREKMLVERSVHGGSNGDGGGGGGGEEYEETETEAVAVWDPERDEMPSPFLVRRRNMRA